MGVVAALAAGDRGLDRPGRRWLAPSVAQPRRPAPASHEPTPSSWSKQNKDWVKNEFESKLKELDEKRANQGPRRRGDHGPPRRRVPERASKSSTEEADVKYPGAPRGDPHAPRRGDQEGRGALSAPDRRPQGKVREGSAPARRVVPRRPRRPPQEQYNQTWDKPDQGLDRGDGADQRGRGATSATRRRADSWTGPGPSSTAGSRPTEVPPGMRFGAFDVDLDQFPNGVPRDPRLKSVPTHFELPALLPFPIQGSLLIKAADRGKDEAITLLQSLDAPLPHLGAGRARSASPSSTRSAWARTSPRSCTWAITTSFWSPTGSGPRRSTSSSG